MKLNIKYYIALFIFSSCTQTKTNTPTTQIVYDGSVTGQFDYGNHLMDENKYSEAKDIFSQQIKLNPTIATLYEQRAMCFSELNNHDSAISDMNIAIKLNPQNISSMYLRGQLKFAGNYFKESILDFDSVLSIKPDFTEAYLGKGMSLLKLNMKTNACDCFSKAQAGGNEEAINFIDKYCGSK